MASREFKATLGVASSLFVLAGVGALVFGIRGPSGEPRVERDFIAEMNDQILSPPKAERAWPVYKLAFAKMDPVPQKLFNVSQDMPHEGEPMHDGWAGYVKSQRDAIRLLVKAARRPHPGVPLVAKAPGAISIKRVGDCTFGGRYPQWLGHTKAAHGLYFRRRTSTSLHTPDLLAANLRLAFQRQNTDQLLQGLEALAGLAAHQSRIPDATARVPLSSSLNRLSAYVLEILEEDGLDLSEAGLARLQERVGRIELNRGAWLERRRAQMHDLVQRIYAANDQGESKLLPRGRWAIKAGEDAEGDFRGVATRDSAPNRSEMTSAINARFDHLKDLDARDPWTFKFADAIGTPPDDLTRVNVIDWAMIDADKHAMFYESRAMVQVRKEGLLAAIAVHRYRLARGRWPAALDDLVPEFLPDASVDVFTGDALVYRLEDGQPVLYAWGSDRDDDGGLDPTDPGNHADSWRPREWKDNDGDVVFLPWTPDEGGWMLAAPPDS